MRKICTVLQYMCVFELLVKYSFGITVYFSNNGGTLAGVPLSFSENDFDIEWDTLLLRFEKEIPTFTSFKLSNENWKGYKLYDKNGSMLESIRDLEKYNQQYIYIVPRSSYFYWPHVHPGHRAYFKNVISNRTIILESISQNPRLFYIRNLIDEEEADSLVNNALLNIQNDDLPDDLFQYVRSDRKLGYGWYPTSNYFWDMNSPTAVSITKRIFALLGMPYLRDNLEGIKIVRYQEKEANHHEHDYFLFAGKDESFNYDPSNGGTNRYATVIIYLNDVGEGGQTMFPDAQTLSDPILNKLDPDLAKILNSHKEFEYASPIIEELLQPDSWESQMAKQCYTKLSVKPKKATAVLFYDVTTNWKIDRTSLHGSCPVLSGTKWIANTLIWNGRQPDKEDFAIDIILTNMLKKKGMLCFYDHELIEMLPGETTHHGTYHTHTFKFKIGGLTVWSHTMDKNDGMVQEINITSSESLIQMKMHTSRLTKEERQTL